MAVRSKKKVGRVNQSGDHYDIISILALIFAFLIPLVGVILGIISLVRIKHQPALRGKGMAIAAVVIGLTFTIAAGILIWWPIYLLSLAGY